MMDWFFLVVTTCKGRKNFSVIGFHFQVITARDKKQGMKSLIKELKPAILPWVISWVDPFRTQ